MKRYAGIGYRKTPEPTLTHMLEIAYKLAKKGYTLSSGGAGGPDSKFEEGCDAAEGNKEIWLPWKLFNGKDSTLVANKNHYDIASSLHPQWKNLTKGVKSLMARNVGEILGEDGSSPVDFVVCYTEDGVEHYSQVTNKSGGTGFAVTLASMRGIPVFNLRNDNALSRLRLFLDETKIFID